MAAHPNPSPLRAVDTPARESLDEAGLTRAYAALEHIRVEHRLERLGVRVDDPILGHQEIVVPRGELPPVHRETPPWWTEPTQAGPPADIELAVALCRTALRVDVASHPVDAAELALRRVEGVRSVGVDVARDTIAIGVSAAAPAALGLNALEIVQSHLDRTVVVEIRRLGGDQAPPPTPIASTPAIIAIHTTPEHGEVEVHLRAGEARSVGRSLLTRGVVGAAEATLEAWHAHPANPSRTIAWTQTLPPSANAPFVVAVALETPATGAVSHGLGTGSNPVDAAVHATVDALTRS